MTAIAVCAQSKTARHFEAQYLPGQYEPADIAKAFVNALAEGTQEGIPWTYSSCLETTSFPRGKLEPSLTLKKLASRGTRHRVVVRVPTRSQDEQLVQVTREAHRCLPMVPGTSVKHLVEAEMLIGAFDDASPFDTLTEAIAAANQLVLRPEFAGTAIAALAQLAL